MTDESVSAFRGRKRKAGEMDRETGVVVQCMEHKDCPGHSKRSARRHREKQRKLDLEDQERADLAAKERADVSSDSDADMDHMHTSPSGPVRPASAVPAEDSVDSAPRDCEPEHSVDSDAAEDSEAAVGVDGTDDSADEEDGAAKPVGRPKSIIELSKALFEGADCSVVQGIELLLQLQARHKLTDAAMAELFDVLNLLLPKSNLVTYAVAKRVMLDLGAAKLEFVDCCVNDCVLFRNADLRFDELKARQCADLDACPLCNEPRSVKGKARKVGLR